MRVPAITRGALALAAVVTLSTPALAQIVLNEVLPAPSADWNSNGIPSSTEDEWVELYNAGASPVDVDGWFLADATDTPRIGLSGSIVPGEHLFLTGEMSVDWESEFGHPAVGLSLNNSGDTVSLFSVAAGETLLVEAYTYEASAVDSDVSLGRLPDGAVDWMPFDALAPGGVGPQPTPGGANGGPATPKILEAEMRPSFPTEVDSLFVGAWVGDSDGIAECTLLGTVSGAPWGPAPMTLIEGTVERGLWEIGLPPQPAGTMVSLYVRVSDGVLLAITNPFEVTVAAGNAPLVLNELLADPPPDLDGDANGDGVRGTSDDEFIEIMNRSETSVDLTGWRLEDASGVRHEFTSGRLLAPGELFVVFGGGDPAGIPSAWAVASSGGLSLNNTEDEVRLIGADGVPRDVHAYGSEAGADQSLIRVPDGDGAWTRPHDAGFSWDFSPGARNESPSSLSHASWGKVKALYRD